MKLILSSILLLACITVEAQPLPYQRELLGHRVRQQQVQNVPTSYSNPASVNDLVLWCENAGLNSTVFKDAGATLCGNSEAVYQWTATQGLNLTQSTAGNRPVYYTDQKENSDAILFSSSSRYMSASSLNLASCTLHFVVKTSGGTGVYRLLIGAASGNFGGGVSSGNKWLIYGTANAVGSSTVSANTWYIVTFIYNGANSAIRVNGVDEGALSVNPNLGSCSGFILGNTGAQSWGGYIGDVIIYSRVLTEGEMDNNEAYLNSKWAIY